MSPFLSAPVDCFGLPVSACHDPITDNSIITLGSYDHNILEPAKRCVWHSITLGQDVPRGQFVAEALTLAPLLRPREYQFHYYCCRGAEGVHGMSQLPPPFGRNWTWPIQVPSTRVPGYPGTR
eukprot:2548882-Rhodomonas_salina.3